jgi:hypothetical protein
VTPINRPAWVFLTSPAALSRFLARAVPDDWATTALLWRDGSTVVVVGALAVECRRYPFLDLRRHLKRLGTDDATWAAIWRGLYTGAAVGVTLATRPELARTALA